MVEIYMPDYDEIGEWDEEPGGHGDYDRLNDETFGTAANEEDWEESHRQMSSLTEAERHRRKLQTQQQNVMESNKSSMDLGFMGLNFSNKRELYHPSREENIPSSMVSSTLMDTDISGSPSSIWRVASLQEQRQLDRGRLTEDREPRNHFVSHGCSSEALHSNTLPAAHIIKTVAQLEQEMKLQHQNQTTHGLRVTSAGMRVDEFERQMARQSMNMINDPKVVSNHSPEQQSNNYPGTQIHFMANHPPGFPQRNSYSTPPRNVGEDECSPTQRGFPHKHYDLDVFNKQEGSDNSNIFNNSNKQHSFNSSVIQQHHNQPPPPQQHLYHEFLQQYQIQNKQPEISANLNHVNLQQQQQMQLQHLKQQHLLQKQNQQLPQSQQLLQQQPHQQQHLLLNQQRLQQQMQQRPHQQPQDQQFEQHLEPSSSSLHGYNNYKGPDVNRSYNNHNDYEFRNGNKFSDRRNSQERRNYDHNHKNDGRKGGHSRSDQRGGGNHDYTNGINSGSGGRVRRDSDAEWEEWGRLRQLDEYAGLMTPKEKSWLKNIQAMQLQTDNPYVEDYYFVMYTTKQQQKRENDLFEMDGLQMMLPDKGNQGKEYEPPRLENSLGKLQVVSVNAPRKIIDLEVVHLDPGHPTTSLQRDMRKHRHLLLHIEKLYNLMMEHDDLERKIRMLPDCPTRDLFESKSQQLVKKLWSISTSSQLTFVQLLCVRKGKTLMGRLLRWLAVAECEFLLLSVLKNLPVVAKRDGPDGRLSVLWGSAERVIAFASSDRILSLAFLVVTQLTTSNKPGILPPLLNNKFGVSIVIGLLVRGELLWKDLENSDAWQDFLSAVITVLASLSPKTCVQEAAPSVSDQGSLSVNMMPTLPAPLPSLMRAAAPQHPSVHLSRCIKLDSSLIQSAQHTLQSLEAMPLRPPHSPHKIR